MKAYVQCSLAKYHAVKNSVSVIHVQIFPSNLESGDTTLKPVALHYFDYIYIALMKDANEDD